MVHELSLCRAIAEVVMPHAAGRRVEVVHLQIGALRQVVPESLEFCWSVVRQHFDGCMADASLELVLVPAEVVCRACEQRSQVENQWSVRCACCDGIDVDIVRGREFTVTSVLLSDPHAERSS